MGTDDANGFQDDPHKVLTWLQNELPRFYNIYSAGISSARSKQSKQASKRNSGSPARSQANMARMKQPLVQRPNVKYTGCGEMSHPFLSKESPPPGKTYKEMPWVQNCPKKLSDAAQLVAREKALQQIENKQKQAAKKTKMHVPASGTDSWNVRNHRLGRMGRGSSRLAILRCWRVRMVCLVALPQPIHCCHPHDMAIQYCASAGITLCRLPQPFAMDVANNRSEWGIWYFVTSLEIPTAAGPVCVENVVYYVIDWSWPELLVGFPVLHFLQFTPDQQLEALAHQRYSLPLLCDSDGTPFNTHADPGEAEQTCGFVIVNGEESLDDIIAGDPEVAKAMESCPFVPASEFARRRERERSQAVSWSVSESPLPHASRRTRKHYSLGRIGKLARRVRRMKRRQVSALVERLEKTTRSNAAPEWTEYHSVCPKVAH